MEVKQISKSTLQRLPIYLSYLQEKDRDGLTNISSPMIAIDLHLNEVQVRKDLAAVASCNGKPRTGHVIKELIEDIESFLGYNNVDEAILVGAGQLGKALLSYKGFINAGLDIVMAFDKDEKIINHDYNGKMIFPVSKMYDLCKRMNIHIGIITVNAEQAQIVCDEMVKCGIQAIWNFAPTHLVVPKGILVQNENMAASLAILSKHLSKKINKI